MKFNFKNFYNKKLKEALIVKKKLNNSHFRNKVEIGISKIYSSLNKGGKVLLCGNGGSAADAQHLAAEFLVRLRPHINREPLPALSLAMDTSTITACANDFSFKYLFSRNLKAIFQRTIYKDDADPFLYNRI